MDRAAETPDDSLHHRKSEAVARGLGGEERIENTGLRVETHSATRIPDLQLHALAGLAGDGSRPAVTRPVRMVITPSRLPIASDALVTRFMTSCRS